MSTRLQITTGGKAPIYRQIADQVRLAVATGALAPGEAVPSVRAQAEMLLVNPNTVARAYGELVREGVLRGEQGRGLFVNGMPSAAYTAAERQRRLGPLVETLLHEAVALRASPEELRGLLDRKINQLKLEKTGSGDQHG